MLESPWEHDQVEKFLRAAIPDGVEGSEAALIIDGMGIPKKGDNSDGVARAEGELKVWFWWGLDDASMEELY